MKTFKQLKTSAIVSGVFLTSMSASHAVVTFYIQQVQAGAAGEDGISTDVYVENSEILKENKSSTGIHTSLLEIGEFGSTFYFYVQGIDDPDGAPILLDSKFVGQYVATADVEVTSADPYLPTRTREDQPFSVKITTANAQWTTAVSNGTAPDITWNPLNIIVDATYEKQKQDGTLVSSGVRDLDNTEGLNSTTLTLIAGNDQEYTSTYTIIPADTDAEDATVPYDSLSSLVGEEKFVIQAQSDSDTDGNPIYRQVASGTVQVWPRAQGKVIGLTENDNITQAMPDVIINLYDLYPYNMTYAQVVPAGTTNAVVTKYLRPDPDTPENRILDGPKPWGTKDAPEIITLTNWDEEIAENGDYTLKVYTKTPFNNGVPELLLETNFTVDRTVTVRGTNVSSE